MLAKIKLHWQILIALILAVGFGNYLPDWIPYVSWMGEVFLRGLSMVVIPLVFSSIISGVASIGGGSNLGRLGMKTLSFYLSTSFVAILTGLFFVNLLEPGVGANLGTAETIQSLPTANNSVSDIFMRLIPENIFDSMANGQILPVIFFAILFGFFITQIQSEKQEILTKLFDSIFEVMMKITMFIIRFTPLGVFALVAKEVSRNSGSLANIAGSLGIYMLTVFLALFFHAGITLPLAVKYIGKANPYNHFRNMATPLLTAFSTSSSNAALPLSMEAVEFEDGVSTKITSFTLPLGATINMDGTALYECVAVIFIAQAYGIHLSMAQQALVVITALLAAIGSAGIPMAGLVMMTIVLTAVNLPLEGIGLVLAVDRILDMTRTTVNVWGDTCAAVIIAKSEGEELKV
ncbi:MAG TPA: dicarboxylate/amino acid:cation symporter [Prolixibacteraceae bacterium]|nr:dicarboxylate/amino acid:cation symporter [Prolixibacteraceae bacterium]